MLEALDDDGERTWTVVLGDGRGTYYEVLDVAGLYLDLDFDLDAADGSILEAKTFLDSASSVTRPSSFSPSLPSAFLLSRSTSGATMKTSRASAARTSSNLNPSSAGGDDHRTPRRARPFLETDQDTPPLPPLPSTTDARRTVKQSKGLQLNLEERGRTRTRQAAIKNEDVHDHQMRLFDQYLLPEQRPLTSRSQHAQPANSSRAQGPVPNTARYLREGIPPAIAMTREDFEALPPTIQRKYFSTLERLRFAQDSCLSYRTGPTSPDPYQESTTLPCPGLDSFSAPAESHHANLSSSDLHFYANLPDKIRRLHLSEEEQLVAQRHRQSVILDAADEAFIKLSRRQSQLFKLESEPVGVPYQEEQYYPVAPPPAEQDDSKPEPEHTRQMEGSLYESFRWLEEDEELDLRLYLDDYHINLRQEVPLLSQSHRPTFRRHLSVSKLPFGRLSTSNGKLEESRDAVNSPAMGEGNGRRRSRALSLISPSKQAVVETPPLFDPATTHYQDPEARMKLRVYLASPQKFDEAIEFGFPAMDDVDQSKRSKSRQGMGDDADNYCTFLEDGDEDDNDDASSGITDGASMNDPDSPRTPDLADKPSVLRPMRLGHDSATGMRGDYAQAPASSREMTLRMTLTRSDLRANEDQIYGWQRGGAVQRKVRTRDGHAPVTAMSMAPTLPKQSLEKYPVEAEQTCCDPNVVKRLWNRVRRT